MKNLPVSCGLERLVSTLRCFFDEILHFAFGSVQDDGAFRCFLSEISHFA